MQARAAIADGERRVSLETTEVGEAMGDELLVEIKLAAMLAGRKVEGVIVMK
jgi:hypothetical protein